MIVVKLTLQPGATIYVLLNQIVSFTFHAIGSTVQLSNGKEILVSETIEEIRSLISSN